MSDREITNLNDYIGKAESAMKQVQTDVGAFEPTAQEYNSAIDSLLASNDQQDRRTQLATIQDSKVTTQASTVSRSGY